MSRRTVLMVPAVAAVLIASALACLSRIAVPDAAASPRLASPLADRLAPPAPRRDGRTADQGARFVDDDGACGGQTPCFTSILAAANVAGDHDLIQVFPGRYTETVAVVNKALRFEGPGAGDEEDLDDPALHALWTAPAGSQVPLLVVDARARSIDGPALSGFRLRPSGTGVLILGRQAGQAPAWPVPPTSTTTTRVGNPRVSGNDFRTAGANPPLGAAIAVLAGDDVVVEDNVARGAEFGVWIEETNGAIVSVNAISGVSAGLVLRNVRNKVGVSGNRLSAGTGMRTGLMLVDVPSALVTENQIVSNTVGIRIVQTRPPSAEDLASIAAFGGLVIGGQPGAGNIVAGSDQALVLENGGAASLKSTQDVSATFNAWGTAYAPVIESRVRHAFDDPRLGRVTYWPALGVPARLGLSVTPDSLPADGVSTAQVVATVRDAAGALAADDALVAWSHRGSGGLTPDSGFLKEAEAAGDGIARQGAWAVVTGTVFGPPSGGAYLRSAQPGATFVFTTSASEVALRYGGADAGSAAGRLRVDVDGAETAQVDTAAPDKRWLTALVARGLGPTTHTVTVSLLAGEVNVDLVVGGASAAGGRSVAVLRAGIDRGEATISALTAGEAPSSLEVKVPIVSPPPATLLLSVLTSTLPVGGFTTTVSAHLVDPLGRPVGDGTVVDFDALLGTIVPGRTRVRDGLAQAVFTSGEDLGLAEVRASSSGLSATAPITLVAGPPAQLSLLSSQTVLPASSLGVANLTITAFDRWSHPVPDGTPVLVAATLGGIEDMKGTRLGRRAIMSTTGGLIQARLRAGNEAGLAEVQVTAGGRAGEGIGGPAAGPGAIWQTVLVTFFALDLKLTKSVDPRPPAVLTPGEPVYYSLNFENASTSTIPEVIVEDSLPSGLISASLLTEGPQVEQQSGAPSFRWRIDRLRPGEGGRIRVRAIVDTSLRWNSRTTVVNTARISSALAAELTPEDNVSRAEIGVVPGAAYTVTVNAPEALRVGGATGEVQATITDRFGNPVIDGTAVFFSTDPSLGRVSPAVATTRRGVARTVFTSGTRRGSATVQALSVDNRAGLAEILLIAGTPRRLELRPDRPRLLAGGPPALVTVKVGDQYGNGVGGESLDFEASGATVTPLSGISDASGDVTVTLRPGEIATSAILTATAAANALIQALTLPIDPGLPVTLTLVLDPPEVKVGGRTTATARVADAFGNPVPGELVAFSSAIGIVRQAVVRTGADGTASTLVLSFRAGVGTVEASTTSLAASAPLAVVQSPIWLPLAWKPAMRR